jgi:hypothetical protein
MPRRNSMTPPQLPRDAPVADVVHPLVVDLRPVVRRKADAAVFHHRDSRLGERLHLHEPLLGNQRLHHGLATLALAHAELVGLDLHEQALRFQVSHHPLASLKPIKALIGTRSRRHLGVAIDHGHKREPVALPCFEIVRIMRWRDLHHARAELRIRHLIKDDRDHTIHQGQNYRASM